MNAKDIDLLIKNPSTEAKGMTRWWWYGCCVEKSEIVRELDLMSAAGLGGVEIQILYPVTPDDEKTGMHNIPYGSPEFYDIISFTAAECKKRNMVCDFTAGSSWPYGGPTVEEEDAQQEALPYQIDVHGPTKYSCDFTTRFAGTVCAAVMGRMENCVMLPETITDITDKFVIKELFGWPWGTCLNELDIPEGDWKLCFFVISQHRNHVGKPSRDAGGLVIDHCSRRAADRFFAQMVKPVLAKADGIRALFCDSIEVEGHNWSGVLLDEFKKRRGYDLTKYIYALWGDIGDITPDVRYDYFKTMSELTIENFFDTMTDFAHENGTLSRIQAHGTWGDILRVYAAADIPEGETFGDHRNLEVNTIHRRLAASAGHIYGKNIVSNETFTWLKRPRFTETLEEMKAAVDAVFVDGMNMIINHGYAYSPEKAGKRGWPFYASTHINHTVPWWPAYKNLAGYITRTSEVLRLGKPVREVAVYLPQADVYSDNMLSELHLAMRLEEHLGRAAMDAIQKAGYWFDYINDEGITSLGRVENGALVVDGNPYRAILLVGCTRMPPETAEKLRDFALDGGVLICEGNPPSLGCGLVEREESARRVRAAMAEARPVITADRYGALTDALRTRLEPDVCVSAPDCVGYVHRADGDTHMYFMPNISDADLEITARFKGRSGAARAWSLNTAEPMPIAGEGCERHFRLAAHESALVVFAPDTESMPNPLPAPARTHAKTLHGWTLRIPETGAEFAMDEPVSWDTLPGLEHFSGTGEYSCAFDFECGNENCVLKLSGMSAVARIHLNSKCLGDIWTHPLEINLTDALVKGRNELKIEVFSTLVNEMMVNGDYEKCPDVLDGWPYFGNVINIQRKARLNNMREFTEQKNTLPSGIWGSVKIEY